MHHTEVLVRRPFLAIGAWKGLSPRLRPSPHRLDRAPLARRGALVRAAGGDGGSGLCGSYDVIMSSKDELLAQVKDMTEEEASQVRLVFAPEWPSKATSIGEIRKRTGTRPMSPEEFDRHFGDLPTDGEG